MKRLLLCCTSAFWLSHSGLAGAVDYSLGDFRLAPIEDPYSIRFQGGSTEMTKEKIAQAIRFVGAAKELKVAMTPTHPPCAHQSSRPAIAICISP